MPLFAPRSEPIKKIEELSKREAELLYAIQRNLPRQKLSVAAEKYRKAQLSLLKAKIHVAMEMLYKKRLSDYNFEQLNKEIEKWNKKTVDEMISDFKLEKKLSNDEVCKSQ